MVTQRDPAGSAPESTTIEGVQLTTTTTGRPDGLHPYVAFAFAADPIAASVAGYRRRDGELGDVGPDALAQRADDREGWLARTESTIAEQQTAGTAHPVGTDAWFEQELLLTELRLAVRAERQQRPFQRAPYLYPERIGEALSTLLRPHRPAPDSVPHPEIDAGPLLSRLRQIPGHLADAAANLTDDTPPLWAQMGVEAAEGLSRFVDGAVRGYAAEGLPTSLAADLTAAVDAAGPAIDGFAQQVSRLAGRAHGSWVAGSDYLDALLTEYQQVDLDADALAEVGHRAVEAADRELTDFAAALDADTPWQQQLADLKNDHPEPADLLRAYGAAVAASRTHTRDAGLLSIPDGESCRLDWVPEYQRASLPLGVMNTVAPYADELASDFLITPIDPAAPADRRAQHLRDNNFVFINSIAGHETYPGHHLQSVHHRLGTRIDSMARYLRSPQFVEGWGLYVEDLLDETGFMTDSVRLFKRRNALWRALRVVVDTGLHGGTLTFDEAVSLLCTRAGMDRHMATGEVRRYTRHDNPTYPSSYLLGRNLLHDLRERHLSGAADGGLLGFHDRLLSFGSAPVPLLESMMAVPQPPADS